MPVDYYPNKSGSELLVMLKAAQDASVGGTITETTAAGLHVVMSQGDQSISNDLKLRRILYSLHLRDPQQWPNPNASRVRRTRTAYT